MFSRVLRFVGAFLLVVQLLLIASPSVFADPAVINPFDINVPCTRDLNPCGNPSQCLCPGGYSYDASIGACLIDDISLAEPAYFEGNQCTFDPDITTRDINPAGYPSMGACEGGSEYNPLIGKCVVQLYY